MRLKNIYTNRYFEDWPSWHLVYEWEDVIAEQLKLSLTDSRKASVAGPFADRALTSLSRRLKLKDNALLKLADKAIPKPLSFCFEMFPSHSFRYSASRHTVPCIIDFWKTQDLTNFYQVYSNCKVVLISSKEVFDWLIQNNCPLNIRHFPLSLSDKYKLGQDSCNKKFDIILAGRTSPVFLKYLEKYEKSHPDIEYLQAVHIDGQLHFKSNKTGLTGNFHKRQDYINLLRSCKAAFYSTPGIDGNEERTGGFNPVTPRLFELAAAGCGVIARYPENPDTEFFNLKRYYPAAMSYDVFEKQLNELLAKDPAVILQNNREFLSANYTSNRVDLLKNILNEVF